MGTMTTTRRAALWCAAACTIALPAAGCNRGSEPSFTIPGQAEAPDIVIPDRGGTPGTQELPPVTTDSPLSIDDSNDYGSLSDLGTSSWQPVWPDPAVPAVQVYMKELPPAYDTDTGGRPEQGDPIARSRIPSVDPDGRRDAFIATAILSDELGLSEAGTGKRAVSAGGSWVLLDSEGIGPAEDDDRLEEWRHDLAATVFDDHGAAVTAAEDGAHITWLRSHERPQTPENAPYAARSPSYLYRAVLVDDEGVWTARGIRRISDLTAKRVIGFIHNADASTPQTWAVYVSEEDARIDRNSSVPLGAQIRAVWLDPGYEDHADGLYIPYDVALAEGMTAEEAATAVVSGAAGVGSHSILVEDPIGRNIVRSVVEWSAPDPGRIPMPMKELNDARDPLGPEHVAPVPARVPLMSPWNAITATAPRGSDHSVSPSPDGSMAAFHRGSAPGGDLWVMSIDGTRQVELVSTGDIVAWPGSVRWSHDGQTLGFSRIPEGLTVADLASREGYFRGLWTMPVASSWSDGTVGPTEIVVSSANRVLSYGWAPDGQRMLVRAMTWSDDSNNATTGDWHYALIGPPRPSQPPDDE